MIDIQQVLQKSIELVVRVAAYIKEEAQQFDANNVELKGKNDLVSYVDKNSERLLVEGLKMIFPEAGFIVEEGSEARREAEYQWIVDPLDGTTNFIHGLPVYAISVALAHRGKIILGIVNELNRNECFYAVKGHGSFLNGHPIHVSQVNSFAGSLLATGFPYHNFEKMPQYLTILDTLMRNTHGLRRMGSAAVDLAYVACGRFEGFFEYNLNAWDVAAGALLVEEAGGTVTDFSGEENYIFGKEIIAAATVHPELLATVQNNWS